MTNNKSNVSTDTDDRRDIALLRNRNGLLVWLDKTININDTDCQHTINQLQQVISNIDMFIDENECVEFLETITNNKACIIISGSLGQHIVPCVHDKSQVDSIFIFCKNKTYHKEWVKKWPKIKGVYTSITPICEALKQAFCRCEQNAISMSFVTSDKRLDQLDPSFMYTQILKEILLTIKFEETHIKDFVNYCHTICVDNEKELNNVKQLNDTYQTKTPIWWYTCESFLYPMLNRSLRLMDGNIITRIGFFINDLHRHIEQLHKEQFLDNVSSQTFTVYRGQGLSLVDFDKMIKTKGGLMSFNNFLSTSKTQEVSLHFAQQAASNPDLVGILFVMTIDPTQSTTPFASIRDVSYFKNEDEILFSMHSVFRVDDITPMDETNRIYQINLTATSDDDRELCVLTQCIRDELCPDTDGWFRLGLLLRNMGQFDRAKEVYEVLFEQTTDESEKASIYYELGTIKYDQGQYQEAIELYEKSVALIQKTDHSNLIDLAMYHNDIGMTYDRMGNYPKALSSHEKALTIREQSLPSDHLDLAMSYNNIGMVHDNMGEYTRALSYFEKALTICQQSLPPNHPHLAMCYNNIGMAYSNIGDYSQAVSFTEKALAIRLQSLPPYHPNLAMSYNNIGTIYEMMGDYAKALSSHEKVLVICQQSLSTNHPNLAMSYNNIGSVYESTNDFTKALLFYEKALVIRQKSLSPDHPDLAASYNNIGMVYYHMNDYSKSLASHEKALEIRQQSLSANHPDVAMSYNNIGMVYDNMNDYIKALSFHEKALAICQQTLPPTHPNLARSYDNLATTYNRMNNYPKALLVYEKALAIRQQSLSSDHPDLAISFHNIGRVYDHMGNYMKSLSFCERAVKIAQQSLPSDHPHLQRYTGTLDEIVKKKLENEVTFF